MRKIVLVYIAIFTLGPAATINADVTIKKAITMEMAGLPSSELTSTEQIQGNKSREVTEFTGGGVMAMMGQQQSAEVNITRLDKGVIWNLNDRLKTYFEFDLKSYRDVMDQSGMEQPSEGEADNYEWTYDIKREEKITEHGFKCEAVIAVANGVNRDNPEDKAQLRYEFWMSGDISGKSELEAYLASFEETTGIDQYDQDGKIDQLGTDFDTQLKKLAESFKDLKGYPVKTVMTIRKSGVAGMPGMPDGEELDPEAMAMMQKMMGGKSAAPAEDGLTTVFSNITEVVSINTDAIEASIFEIPEGYTRQ